MSSGKTVSEKSFEYAGVVALAGGGSGGGGGGGIEPDYEYNKRMAEIAEKQQEQAERYEQYWAQVQAPYEKSVTESQNRLNSYQEASEYAEQLRKLGLTGDTAKLEKAQLQAQQYLLPQQTNLASLQIGSQLAALPYQTQNVINKLAAENYLLPQQTNLQSALIGAQQYLLPQHTGLESAKIGKELYLLPQQTKTASEFFKATLPTSTSVRAGQAVSDVNLGFDSAEGSLNRSLGRMGVSGAAAVNAQKDLATNRALSLAGAANVGRSQAETSNFNKLSAGMQYTG